MKLLFVIKSLSLPGGGAERVLAEISSGLAERGHQVAVISYDPPDASDFYPFHPAVRRVRLGIGDSGARSGVGDTIRRALAVRREVKRTAPEVVVAFMHSAYIPVATALAGTGIPVVASEHIVYSHYDTRPVDRLLLRLVPRLVTAITAISEGMRRDFPPPIRGKMTIVPNPVRAAPGRRADPVGGVEKVVLSVGRLEEQKDQRTLVEAFARVARRFPEWRLRILGEGVLRPQLEAQMAALGLGDRVALPGATADIGSEYLRAQLFAMPSTYESFGLATAEALAHGLPAIGFADCPGTNELIVDGENGLLVAGGDRPAALAAGLARLMASPEERLRMSAAGPARLAAFSPERVVERWEALLAAASARGGAR